MRSFGELLRPLHESAFSSPRIDVFLLADSCFPECGIITHAVVRGSIATALTKDSSLWVWGSLVKDAEPVTTPIKVAEGINYVYLAKQRDIYVIKNDGKLYKYQYETEELERVFE